MVFRRRFIAFGLGLVLLMGVVWGRQQQVQSVTILMPAPYADATAALVDRFNDDHRGRIHLNISRGPLETESISDLAISSLLLGSPPFDALLVDVTWLPKYVAAGWLEPLDPWFDQADEDDLVEGARLGNRVDGALYRWPLGADVGLLYWRTDLMPSPPTTPDQLTAVVSKLKQEGRASQGFVWQGRQYEGLSCDFVELLQAFGGSWISATTGEPNLDSPAAKQTATWMNELISNGFSPRAVTNYAESESLQAFKAGDAALMRNWPYAWSELQGNDSAVRGRVGVTTMVALPGETPAATLGSWGLSMLRETPHPSATAEAIRYLTSQDAQRERFLNQGYTPTAQALFRDPELVQRSPVLPQLEKALGHAVPRPMSPLYAQMSDVLQRQLSGILTGDLDPGEGMAQAQASTITLFRSAGGKA